MFQGKAKFISRKLLVLSVFLGVAMPGVGKANDMIPVLKKIEQSLAPENFVGEYQFKNFRTDGTVSEYSTHIESRNVDLQYIRFTEPAREKGREVLRNHHQLWTFVPSVGKVIKIEDRESFAGGDFSNADILRVDWLAQYDPSLSKDAPKQWIIDLKAKTAQAAYAKMRLWVKKETGQPVQQEFFDSNGILLKRLRYGNVQTFGEVTRPALMLMENVITQQRSELRIQSIVLKKKIPEDRFIMDNLGK